MDRLLLALVNGDVGGVEVGSVVGIAFRIQSALESRKGAGRLWKNDRTALRQGFKFYCERALARHPFSFQMRGVPGSGRKDCHGEMRGVQINGRLTVFVCGRTLPGLVRKKSQQVGTRQGLADGAHGDDGAGRALLLRCRGGG